MKRCYIGIAAMILTNVVLDLVLVSFLHMGVFGLALATALANWVYFLILVQYYLTGKAQLAFTASAACIRQLKDLLLTVLICQAATSYFQAIGRMAYVNILSVFDGFLAMVIPAALLAPLMGAYGVWAAIPIGIAATILLSLLYCVYSLKRWPRSLRVAFAGTGFRSVGFHTPLFLHPA